jgi:putative ABC transport system permease protein
VNGYTLRSLRAHVRQGRALYLLTALGVALGVASVLGIQILNRSALAVFRGSVRAVSGEVDLTVLGSSPTLPERLYPEVLAVEGVAAAWPLYRVEVALAARPDLYLEVVGFDLLAPVRLPMEAAPEAIATALRTPGWAAVTPELASDLGWEVGDSFEVTSGSRRATLVVGALVDFRKLSPLASRRLVVMDIGEAQRLLGRPGRVHQIDVRVQEGEEPPAVAARIEERLPPGARVVTPEQREQDAARLLGAFRLNLTALSLISLLVGAFLVFTSTQASLVRRRAEIGLLRSLGATRLQVLALILAEVALVGLAGVAVGLPLGYAAAAANLEVVSGTVSNLYLLEEIERLEAPTWLFALAAAIGVGGALAGALLPALDASRRDARALLAAYTLHERMGRASGPMFAAGAALPALGGIAYASLERVWRPAGFVLAFAIVAALPLVAPLVVRGIAGAWRPRGFGPGYSVRTLAARLHVTAFAVGALAVAVSMLVGITLMVGSFRRTLDDWVRSSVRADVFVAAASWGRAEVEATLDADLVEALGAWPGVRGADRLRRTSGRVGGRRVGVAGIDMKLPGGETRVVLLEGDAREAMRRAAEEGAALVSEPLARATGIGPGDALPLATQEGEVALPVAGVFHDYGNESGLVLLDLATLARLFGPGPPHSVALYLEAGRDAERVAGDLRAAFAGRGLRIRSNRTLREDVLRVFDRTFAVTRFLQAVCLLVAVCGVTLTLLVIARERVSELALYRALGARRRQIFGVFLGKGLGMAALGMALGTVAGIALALVLIFGINRAYFGWTLRLHWPWPELVRDGAIILAAAAAAALYPAARASRTPAAELSREEVA